MLRAGIRLNSYSGQVRCGEMMTREQRIFDGGRRGGCKGARAGLTMAELLVVVAIIGLMAGIAVPTFVRMGYFSQDDSKQTARRLYSMLRAAREFAATHRVNTAVAYFDADSDDGPFLRAMVFYENTNLEVKDESGPVRFYYVPADSSVVPEPFQGNTGILNRDGVGAFGTMLIDILMTGESADDPVGTTRQVSAHVFDPSGRLKTEDERELFTINVGYTPVVDEMVRFDDQGRERIVKIELQKSTGRVRIATE